MQQVIDYADATDACGERRRSWITVHHRYRTFPNQGYLARFQQYLQKGGTKRQKIQSVDVEVYRKFVVAREKCLPVHDFDIQRGALLAAREMSFTDFVASRKWVSHFKTKHKIVSRKITNIVTKHEVAKSDAIEQSKVDFLDQYKKLAQDYSPDQIYNTDQVGVEEELRSTRSLSFQGEKKNFRRCAERKRNYSFLHSPAYDLSIPGRTAWQDGPDRSTAPVPPPVN